MLVSFAIVARRHSYDLREKAREIIAIFNGESLSSQNRDFNGGRPQGMFPPPHGGMMPMGGPGNGPLAGGGIGQFDVKYATAVPDEKDVVLKDKSDSLYHYFVENVKFGKPAKIHFLGDGVECEGMPADVQMAKDEGYLTITSASVEPLAIELSGKTENGALVLNVEAPLKLLFNNVVIKSKRGDAILSQGKGHVYAVLGDSSVNELYDCDNPEFAMFQGLPPGGMGMGGPRDLMDESKDNSADYHVQYGITMKKPQMKKKLKIDGTVNLRDAYNLLPEVFYQMASKASELIYWDSNTKYCGVCGTPLNWQTDISKQCPNCGKEVWPQVSPAIIVRIEKKECYEESKILLVKAKNFTRNFYGLVAGFLETGETLEQCVEREILEETQLKVCNIKYFGSQYWPYPSSIMIGFTADYASGELSLQLDELNAGGWFTINTLPDIPDKMSIARQLIDDWIKKQNNNTLSCVRDR